MICKICARKDAAYEIAEIVNNKRKILNVCKDCRDKYQSFEFDTYFNNLSQQPEGITNVMKCLNCNLSLSDLFKYRELGCEHCYKQFREFIDQIANDIEHVGKAPIKKISNLTKDISLSDVESKLKSAIEREDFITAQKLKELRDRLISD